MPGMGTCGAVDSDVGGVTVMSISLIHTTYKCEESDKEALYMYTRNSNNTFQTPAEALAEYPGFGKLYKIVTTIEEIPQ